MKSSFSGVAIPAAAPRTPVRVRLVKVTTLPFTLLFSLLFLLTALGGVLVSYDPAAAWQRFWLIMAALLLLLAVTTVGQLWGERALTLVAVACGGLAAALGVYWLLTYNWQEAGLEKFALLQQLGLWIQAHRPVLPLGRATNANVAGAGLVVLLPPAAAGAAWAYKQGRLLLAGAALLSILPALGVLLLTSSRGAWLGGAVGVGVAALLWLRRRVGRRHPLALSAGLCLLALPVALAVFFAVVVSPPAWAGDLSSIVGAAGVNRAMLWQHGLDLVSDYPFTGSGLQGPMMVHSSYVLLLHVGFITHMHNLFLEIAVEQGLPALLLFLALLAGAGMHLWRAAAPDQPAPLLATGAAAGLAALAVHGLWDAGLYASRLAPLLFLAPAFCLALPVRQRPKPKRIGALGWLGAAVLLAGALLLPGVRAAFQANLGAVAQTQAELSRYQWPEWPIQDALRRSDAVDLGPAMRRYYAALTLDPANAAANRRLGQIQLSQGDYSGAYRHLWAAYAAAPRQRAGRQLLAEAAAIEGDSPRAAFLLRSVEMDQGQWTIRQWWHGHLGETENVARLEAVARKE